MLNTQNVDLMTTYLVYTTAFHNATQTTEIIANLQQHNINAAPSLEYNSSYHKAWHITTPSNNLQTAVSLLRKVHYISLEFPSPRYPHQPALSTSSCTLSAWKKDAR